MDPPGQPPCTASAAPSPWTPPASAPSAATARNSAPRRRPPRGLHPQLHARPRHRGRRPDTSWNWTSRRCTGRMTRLRRRGQAGRTGSACIRSDPLGMVVFRFPDKVRHSSESAAETPPSAHGNSATVAEKEGKSLSIRGMRQPVPTVLWTCEEHDRAWTGNTSGGAGPPQPVGSQGRSRAWTRLGQCTTARRWSTSPNTSPLGPTWWRIRRRRSGATPSPGARRLVGHDETLFESAL